MSRSARAAFAALCLVGMLGWAASTATAGDGSGTKAKDAFEKLKGLAGEWKTEGNPKDRHHMDGKVVFKVTAAGSALMQHQFPGSDHEMVTMYHLDGDNLLLTHYCAAGNQPRMKLDTKASTADELVFVFDGGTNLDPAKDMHIHALRTTFKPGGLVHESWDAYSGGKKAMTQEIDLSRP